MSHGKAPRHPSQGSAAQSHEAAPKTSGKHATVNHVTSTPGMSCSKGVHVPPIGGKGTVGKPGATPKPKPID